MDFDLLTETEREAPEHRADAPRPKPDPILPQATPPNRGSLSIVSQLVGQAISYGVEIGRPFVKRLLPAAALARLAGIARLAEDLAAPSMLAAFEKRSRSLSTTSPLSSPDRSGGPIVLANNALAWGGVERQIIYTLLGLQAREAGDLGLLCVRLGIDAEHDFYRKDLRTFGGFVRNVMPSAAAEAYLQDHATPAQRDAVGACTAWMPIDVQREIRRFLADFCRLRPAVVHAWQDGLSTTAGYAAHLAGVPRIIVAGRNVAPHNFGYHRPYMAPAYRELAACAGVTMINNSRAGATSYAKWLGLPADRIAVIRNGIDTAVVRAPAAAEVDRLRDAIGIPARSPVVGSIFRFYPEKQPILWIEAAGVVAKARPDVHFVVIGTGPLRGRMRARARRLGFADRLHLPGTLGNPSVALKMFDAFLLASRFEGTPNVVLEAGLLGVPVVATDAGGTAEAVDAGRSGFIVASGGAGELGARVVDILADPGFGQRVARDATAFVVQRFGLERMIDDTLSAYARPDKGGCVR